VLQHQQDVTLDEEDLKLEDLKNVLTKELYLLDVDRDHFIGRVLSKIDKSKATDDKEKLKLTLSTPNKIDIENFIDKTTQSSLLYYRTIKPDQKQFEKNKILTVEYLQCLQLMNTPNMVVPATTLIKDLSPIVAKYADTIINIIFKELSNNDPSTTMSTLTLLNTFVRPYLSPDSTTTTELFILYKIVIPYLYDNFGIKQFIDYFH